MIAAGRGSERRLDRDSVQDPCRSGPLIAVGFQANCVAKRPQLGMWVHGGRGALGRGRQRY